MSTDKTSRRDFIKIGAAVAVAPLLLSSTKSTLAAETPVAVPVSPGAVIKIQSLNYQGVRLLPGPMKTRYEQTRDYYFHVPDDDILKGFRRRAGLPAPGRDMGGWASKNSEIVFGQWLSGMSRMYAGTHDVPMRDKAVHLLTEFSKTLSKFSCGHYGYEKFVCGLVDLPMFTGDRSGLPMLEHITQWAQRHLGRKRLPATDADSQGGFFNGELEWYTLPENLYRAYQLTGNPMYRDFAQVWHYPAYWNMFDGKQPPAPNGFHAYSHCNALSSLAMTYAVTGDPSLLKCLINAYDYFDRTQCYVTGGYGPGEKLMTPDGSLGESIIVEPNQKYLGGNVGRSFETPCGTWAIFKLCDYLIQFTGQARFGDWMERAVYNGIGAALPMSGRGTTFYYADYRMNKASKQYYGFAWPCCAGTFIQDVSHYLNIIYYKDNQGPLVNLYVPSEMTWTHAGRNVTLIQRTEYPASERSELEIRTDSPIELAVRLRVPSWAQGYSIHVNGKPTDAIIKPGDWATIRRMWNTGDRISVRIPLAPRLVPIDRQHPDRVAAACGPVAMVHVSDGNPVATRAQFNQFTAAVGKPIELDSSDKGDKSAGKFVPFFNAEKGQPYHMYFDLEDQA
jgi:hypothetical protein